MAWAPKSKALNLRAIADNLLAFWTLNQEEAIPWAAAELGYVDEIPLLKKLAQNAFAMLGPNFPAVGFASDADAADYNDAIASGYIVRFLCMVTGPDPDICVRQARVYALALTSMMLNCPKATLTDKARVVANNTQIEDTVIEFEEVLSDEERTEYYQSFQLQATIRVHASSLEGA